MRFCKFLSVLILFLPLGARAHIDARTDCLNTIRTLEEAKETLALENRLSPGAPVEPEMLSPYVHGGTIPHCRAGGRYTIGPIGTLPVCSMPGHSEAAVQRDMEARAKRQRLTQWTLISSGIFVATWVVLSTISARRKAKRLPVMIGFATIRKERFPNEWLDRQRWRKKSSHK